MTRSVLTLYLYIVHQNKIITRQHGALLPIRTIVWWSDIDPDKAQFAASPCYSVRWENGETNLESGTVVSRSIKAVVSAAFLSLVRSDCRLALWLVNRLWRHAKWRKGLRNSEPPGGWCGGWSSSQSCVGVVAYVWIYSHGNMMSLTSDRFLSVKLCQLGL